MLGFKHSEKNKLKFGLLHRGKKYKSSLNIDILDNDEVIYKFNSLRAASKSLNISRPSLVEYSKSEKLWNYKYKFKIYK